MDLFIRNNPYVMLRNKDSIHYKLFCCYYLSLKIAVRHSKYDLYN